jgi:hypothetical protein
VWRNRLTVLSLVPPKMLSMQLLDKNKYNSLMLVVLEKTGN